MASVAVGDRVEWDLPSKYGRYMDEAFINLLGHGPFEIIAVYEAEDRPYGKGQRVGIIKKGTVDGLGLRWPLRAELFRKC